MHGQNILCDAVFPSNCIYIEAAENRISGGERYAKVYNIDYTPCISCGHCIEASRTCRLQPIPAARLPLLCYKRS